MKLKKIDLSGVKDFLFNKGERIGVVVCGAIAIVFVGIGIMHATGARTPYPEEFGKQAARLQSAVRDDGKAAPPVDTDPPPAWPLVAEKLGAAHQPLIIITPGGDENKRLNPNILKVPEDPQHIQVDFFRAGYFSYELEKEKEKVWAFGDKPAQASEGGAGRALTRIMKPGRFVLVTAVFPWREQVKEYRKKLRYKDDQDGLKPEDWPQPAGLIVWRCEIKPDGKATEWEHLFKYDERDDKQEVADRIVNLYREAYIDVDTPNMFGAHIQQGLVTPLPWLANMTYPKPVNLMKDIKVDEEGASKQPKGPGRLPSTRNPKSWRQKAPGVPGGNEPEITFSQIAWKDVLPDLHDQFMGKIDFFSTTGIMPKEDTTPLKPGPAGRDPRRGGMRYGQTKSDKELVDALVRFIDVGVEVGKTYRYGFSVRMLNPNSNHKDVAYQSLAEKKELVSESSLTPPVTITDEYAYYAVDKQPDNPITGGSDTKEAKADKDIPYAKWTTTVQVHRWVGKFTDKAAHDWTVADWAIAERLLVRRGDTIGRYEVMVEVPTWEKKHEALEIGFLPQKVNVKEKTKARAHTGIPINFILEKDTANPPLLVDFEGGVKHGVKAGNTLVAKDESAVEMLILTPEGKLAVRNSRVDTDSEERQARFDTWQRTVKALRATADNAPMPGPGGKRIP